MQSYFVKRVEKILTAKGRKLIGSAEIREGGSRHKRQATQDDTTVETSLPAHWYHWPELACDAPPQRARSGQIAA